MTEFAGNGKLLVHFGQLLRAADGTCICDNLYNSSQWDLCQATKISAVLEISSSKTSEGTFKPKT